MNKLFSYSKFAGVAFFALWAIPFIIIIFAESMPSFFLSFFRFSDSIISLLRRTLWLVFFLLLIHNSSESSQIYKPSVAGALGMVLLIISPSLAFPLGPFFGEPRFSNIVHALLYVVGMALFVYSFMCFSNHFKKGSFLYYLSIALVIFGIICGILRTLRITWMDYLEMSSLTRSYIYLVIGFFGVMEWNIIPAFFMLFFSKLNK